MKRVEQAFRPAVRVLRRSASAAAVFPSRCHLSGFYETAGLGQELFLHVHLRLFLLPLFLLTLPPLVSLERSGADRCWLGMGRLLRQFISGFYTHSSRSRLLGSVQVGTR